MMGRKELSIPLPKGPYPALTRLGEKMQYLDNKKGAFIASEDSVWEF
jgi:hypothetical protein